MEIEDIDGVITFHLRNYGEKIVFQESDEITVFTDSVKKHVSASKMEKREILEYIDKKAREGIACPWCGGETVTKSGFKMLSGRKVQQWQCKTCGKIFKEEKKAPPVITESEGIACPGCGCKNVKKNGFQQFAGGRVQQWQCKDCGKYFAAGTPKS